MIVVEVNEGTADEASTTAGSTTDSISGTTTGTGTGTGTGTTTESTSGDTNLSESNSETDPVVIVPLEPVQASLELVSDKTFRISWQPLTDAQFYRVLENADGVSGFLPITGNLDASIQSYDHRVALCNRTNAQHVVQACNLSSCTDSTAQFVTGTLWNAVGYIKASNTDARDLFGISVSFSANGDTLAIGAVGESSATTGVNGNQSDDSARSVGAVYLY